MTSSIWNLFSRLAPATTWVSLVAIAVLSPNVTACSTECADLCDAFVTCSVEELDENDCEYEDDPGDVKSECEETCGDAIDTLSDSEKEEVSECIACLLDEIGNADECNEGDFADALEDCDNDCEEDGMEEFGEEFYEEFEPDIDCKSSSSVCDQAAAVCLSTWTGDGCSGTDQCVSECIVGHNSCDFEFNESLVTCASGC